MIDGGFGFPLLLGLLVILVAWQTTRDLILIAAAVYMQFRVRQHHRAPAEDGEPHRRETETSAS